MANKFSGFLGIAVISALILPFGTSAGALEDTSNNSNHSITDHSAAPPVTEIGNEGLDSEEQVDLPPQQAESELVARAGANRNLLKKLIISGMMVKETNSTLQPPIKTPASPLTVNQDSTSVPG